MPVSLKTSIFVAGFGTKTCHDPSPLFEAKPQTYIQVEVQGLVLIEGGYAAAIIEVKQGYTCTEEDVNNFCMELPKYKRPRKIIFAPVPRNPTGKIEKPKLREMYRTEDPFAVMKADS